MTGTQELMERLQRRRSLPGPVARRAIRVASGASQADVAAALGVSQRTVSRWESGARTPHDAVLPAYLELLDRLSRPQGVAS